MYIITIPVEKVKSGYERNSIKTLEYTFEIQKHIATLLGSEGEVTKQINLVSWNDRPAVIDIRAWSSKGKPYKGIVLNTNEAKALKEALEMVF